MALAPGTVFAGFTIEATLGVGGMGTVYVARHPRLPRSDALKLLRPELSYDPDFAVRFAREADIAARLSHPNIVGVNDRGVEDGQLWISMPYIAGMDAEQALAESRGPLPARRAIRIVGEIAAALDFAHRNGLWHRDVKPANILLAPGHDDEPERVLLTDFGIAKAADEGRGLTRTGSVIATFDYAPPEQIEGRPFDHRVDVYALGCVLYKLLTGSVPYPGTTMAAALYGHLNLPPPRPTGRTPWLAPGLDDVIASAMAKDPDARYPNCRSLASAAQTALSDLPAPPALPYSVSATHTDAGSGRQMVLGPLDTEDLSPPDRNGLLGLVRQSRLFDLPADLPAPEPGWNGAATESDSDPSESAGEMITIVVRATGRTATVSYLPALSPRPSELDDLLQGLEDRLSWRPAGADSSEPSAPSLAPVTVVERRPESPPYVATPVEEPRLPQPAAASFLAAPAQQQAATPVPASPPQRPDSHPVVARPALGRRRLVALLVAALLVVGAGVTTLILTQQDGTETSGDPAPSSEAGSDEAGPATPPTSAELGLPNAEPLADTVLVANHQIDGNVDLYAVDSVTGETRERLTSNASPDVAPVISPDRSSVVYASQRGEVFELWVVAADGTGSRALFEARPAGCDSVRRPAWNPADPSMLAVICLDVAGTVTLQLLRVSGELIRTLEPGLPQFDDLTFSPDGRTLAYWASPNPAAGDGHLYALATDGSSPPVQLTDPTLSGSADAIWSPDGSQIAFRALVDDANTALNTEIFVMAADGANPQPLAAAAGLDQDPAWSPDGAMIVFKSDRADGSGVASDRLWIMNRDGSNFRLLTSGSVADGYAPAWSNR